ncbi:MAG TPA: hypothetical protein VGC84_08425, partial [Ilumatobacteraceae bacterium]
MLASVGISLGAAGIASAASSTGSPVAAVAATAATTPADPTTAASSDSSTSSADNAAPSYTSSVTIPVAADGSKPTDAQLQAVATVTSDQAIAAAIANTPGTAGTAELKSVA